MNTVFGGYIDQRLKVVPLHFVSSLSYVFVIGLGLAYIFLMVVYSIELLHILYYMVHDCFCSQLINMTGQSSHTIGKVKKVCKMYWDVSEVIKVHKCKVFGLGNCHMLLYLEHLHDNTDVVPSGP